MKMIDKTLRECPFCGNPAEIVDGAPYSFFPSRITKAIRCSNQWCFAQTIDLRFMPESKSSEIRAREDWNRRRRKNKLTWREDQS